MSRIRIRRPLLALIVLVAALLIGYGVRALHEHHDTRPSPTRTSAATALRALTRGFHGDGVVMN